MGLETYRRLASKDHAHRNAGLDGRLLFTRRPFQRKHAVKTADAADARRDLASGGLRPAPP
jgi:hypothetical protein